MGPFYANIGPIVGATLYDMVPDAVGIFEEPGGFGLIGMAHCIEKGVIGVAVWRLVVHGVERPGRWVIVDREFRPAR